MKKINRTIAVAMISACLCVPSFALAQGRGHGHAKGEKSHSAKAHDDSRDHVAIDREAHARVIHEYAHSGSLPPGLAKREQLPPGLRKQLHERGQLPPGLQKRLIDVPTPLIARLPAMPPYYHRYFAGDDLLVVDTRTNRIAAIVPNVWR